MWLQVMGSDEQTTLVIDAASLGGMAQLVEPKVEPVEVVQLDGSQLLEQVTSASILTSEEMGLLGVVSPSPGSGTAGAALVGASQEGASTPAAAAAAVAVAEGLGLQLSAEQLMNLSTGDYLQINGEMFKVEVSAESNPDGSLGQQIISFEPAPSAHALAESSEGEVSLEAAQLS